ncbi:hypothetical protein O181_103285 [Austropuccinia psidii MF-1]|uniref:Uncharacterized protein n=1 Tax=Austropuccinia psidii MF-1 TaxID=1389203 RepID=A0A9Q3PJM4_9BASI|nr:hypothetical protein [Austropuccinia psidii MF-1]
MILTDFFSGDHSGPSLSNNFLSILKQKSLDDAIICIMAHNPSANQQMEKESASTNMIGCMAHVLNLEACDGKTSATTPEDEDLPALMFIASLVTPLIV